MSLGVVEICAGAGGQSLGLHLAGFRHQIAVEIDATAAGSLRSNLSRIARDDGSTEATVAVGDVADKTVWDPEDYVGISLLAGGVPCPPFSIAGKQLGASDERDLFAWAVEVAGRMQPSAVMLENVRGLSMPRFAGYRQAVINRFSDLGYVADWQLLEAKDYGVAQLRPRFVLVALKPEFSPFFRWPDKKPTTDTVGSVLRDLMGERGWRGADRWAEMADSIAPTIVGGSKKHGGPDLGPTRARAAWAELGVDGIGIADEAPSRSAAMSHRPKLTVEMVKRLQGWHGPEYEWHIQGRKTAAYRQVGNAFPPPVARAVGMSIASALRKEGDAREIGPADRVTHDEVYQILRSAGRPITAANISRRLSASLAAEEVHRRIQLISKDFHVHESVSRGEKAFTLGDWKAFRGESDHERFGAFATAAARARIS